MHDFRQTLDMSSVLSLSTRPSTSLHHYNIEPEKPIIYTRLFTSSNLLGTGNQIFVQLNWLCKVSLVTLPSVVQSVRYIYSHIG